ncbi:MAG: hypothetical protein Q8912_03665 [Bacillota bacterium]|nr:hypothetical protein [Bacillota bacterium]MDP4158730.1 hypothetical protein [Bacillota bacterium]
MKTQYLVIPVSDDERKRLDYVCTRLGITLEKFFDNALREGEMEALSNDAFKPGGSFWDNGETFKKDAE